VASNPFAVALRTASAPQIKATYAGAQIGRLMGDWVMGSVSADRALYSDLLTLRNRARELVISNATAARVPTLFAENVIGKDGILYQAAVRSTRDLPNKPVNKALETAWYRWSESNTASPDGRRSWCETESLIAESEPTDGEVLIRLLRGFDNPFGFAVDLLDPDQLDEKYNVEPGDGRNEIRMGVEVDRWQRPVAYHLWNNHPSERRNRTRTRVPAEEIIHLYVQKRPRQTRGVTWFAPVVFDLKMLGGWREAHLVASRTASAKMGFLQQHPDAAAAPMTPEDPTANHIQMDADPGVIEQLPPGFTFESWDPTFPSTNFSEYDKAIVRTIATALRVSYISLSGDLSDTSYSSGRVGLLAERTVYEKLQQRHIERVSTPIFRAWLQMAMLKGAVSLPSYDATAYHACSWHPRSFPWVDPAADVETAEMELNQLKITSRSRLAAQKGLDYEELLQERQKDRDLEAQYGEPEEQQEPNAESGEDDNEPEARVPRALHVNTPRGRRLIGGR
jgi:lambda family phage portal protein